MKLRTMITIAGILVGALAMRAQAAWPDKPVTIVVPFAAGGNTDSIARITAQWLTKKLGQPVIVDNRPGANGAIAAGYVARSQTDGYTLFMATLPQMAILPHMQKVEYDPVKSFAPISIVATNAFALAVNSSFPANTLTELVSEAKAHPGAINYASAGSGSVSHLTMALLLKRSGITMNHVAYKGGAPAISDVIGGHIPIYFGNLAEVLPQIKSGKLKVLAVSGAKRTSHLPGVATVAEQGLPGFETLTWNGLAAPAGTPQEVVSAIANALKTAPSDSEFKAKLSAIGVDALCNTPEQFAEMLKADLVKWREAVEISGATVQ